MSHRQPDELDRVASERRMRDHVTGTLRKVLREDLDEAINLGLLSREQAADEAMRVVLDWKAKPGAST